MSGCQLIFYQDSDSASITQLLIVWLNWQLLNVNPKKFAKVWLFWLLCENTCYPFLLLHLVWLSLLKFCWKHQSFVNNVISFIYAGSCIYSWCLRPDGWSSYSDATKVGFAKIGAHYFGTVSFKRDMLVYISSQFMKNM